MAIPVASVAVSVNPQEPPDDIKAYVSDVYDLLGLSGWDVAVKMVDALPFDADDDSPGSYGECPARTRYREPYRIATVELVRGRTMPEYRESIMHELLHLALSPMTSAGDQVAALLEPRQEQAALRIHSDAEERVISHLAKMLVRGVKPSAPSPEA